MLCQLYSYSALTARTNFTNTPLSSLIFITALSDTVSCCAQWAKGKACCVYKRGQLIKSEQDFGRMGTGKHVLMNDITVM